MNHLSGSQVLPKTTSLHFLYENRLGRLLFNEEGRSIWTGCKKPYKEGVISLAEQEPDLDKDELRAAYVRSIPRCKNYRGLLLHGYLISPKFMREMPHFPVRPDDLFICSYPRSGTTWMEEILSCVTTNFDKKFMSKKVHDRVAHLEAGRTFGQARYLKNLKSPRLLGTHLPLSHCPDQLKDLHCKIIYVARNPKDQAVSYYYFHSTAKYLGKKKWDWDTFLQLYLAGHLVYGSWYDHVRDWYLLARERPDKVLFVTYEELQVNLGSMLFRIADFVGIQLEAETVDQIVRHCGFSHMKKNPAVNREDVPVTDLFVPTEFMRKGIIGDWKNHFSETQSQAFDRKFEQEMDTLPLRFAYNTKQAVELINRSVVTGPAAAATITGGPSSRPAAPGTSEASLLSSSTELMIEQTDQRPLSAPSGSVVYRKSRASQTAETRMSDRGGRLITCALPDAQQQQQPEQILLEQEQQQPPPTRPEQTGEEQAVDEMPEKSESGAMQQDIMAAIMTMMPPPAEAAIDVNGTSNGKETSREGDKHHADPSSTDSSMQSNSMASFSGSKQSDESQATGGKNSRQRRNAGKKSQRKGKSDAARVFPIDHNRRVNPEPKPFR
jgi:hypothetical protein